MVEVNKKNDSYEISVSVRYMVFENGKLNQLYTNWDTEKKIAQEENKGMNYSIATLKTNNIFSSVKNWSFNIDGDSFNVNKAEKKVRKETENWKRKHVFVNRDRPLFAKNELSQYFTLNCKQVNLVGHKTTVFAFGNTMVNVREPENTVCICDKNAKYDIQTYRNATNVHAFFKDKEKTNKAETAKINPFPKFTKPLMEEADKNIEKINKSQNKPEPKQKGNKGYSEPDLCR